MHVSTNRGEHFDAVQLPAVEEEQFYSILDATEDMIFMHIDEKGDTGKGIIYTSDEKGIVYTESLNNNLYPNGEDVTDFVKIESLRGVYVTSMLKGDSSIESVISFDKGASWVQFDEPLNCNSDNARCGCNTTDEYCHLQLHNSFSMAKGVEIPDTTYSSSNSPGLILAHGNVGDGLTTEAPDLFVSNDGGYQWNLALKGMTHIYDSYMTHNIYSRST
jgi:sortilin